MDKILITTSKLIKLDIKIELFKDRSFLEKINNGVLETKISKVYRVEDSNLKLEIAISKDFRDIIYIMLEPWEHNIISDYLILKDDLDIFNKNSLELKQFNNKNIKLYFDESTKLCNSLYFFESK